MNIGLAGTRHGKGTEWRTRRFRCLLSPHEAQFVVQGFSPSVEKILL
jgi:hypothetical protein